MIMGFVAICRRQDSLLNLSRNLSGIRFLSAGKEEKAEHFDVVISGGGLVGTTLACAISKNSVLADKKVLLLEGAPKFKGFSGTSKYSNRASALNHGTIDLMKSIGAWEFISSQRYKPVKQMQVWDACSDAFIEFNHDNFNDDVAYMIENDLVLHAVYQQLENSPSVQVKNLSRVQNVQLLQNGVSKNVVELVNGETFTCDLLIGADGANSLVRKQMNVDVFRKDYNQMGLVATIELSDAGDNSVAWQRFLPTGPVALLPLTDNLSSLVWCTTREHAKLLESLSPQEFVDALNDAYWKEYPKDSLVANAMKTLGAFLPSPSKNQRQYPPAVKSVKDKSRACFPLGFSHAASYVCKGAALVGDAAHRIHPLAGQGVNLGFGDVKCLTKVLETTIYNGSNIGDIHYLLKYEKERLIKNVPVMIGVHGLQSLYSTTFSPIVMLRSVGLQFTQNVPLLKNFFMKTAMG